MFWESRFDIPTIEVANDEIIHREAKIRRLLGAIARDRGGPSSQRIAGRAGAIVIGTHDGSPPQSNYQSWRFSTFQPGVLARYFEIWNPVDSQSRLWALGRAYLTIYEQPDRLTEKEVLSLHCDPDESDQDEKALAKYKKGPHLHITSASHPLPRAHIALALGHLEQVLKDVGTLTEAFEQSINMIKDEILDHMTRN